jgi:DNA-binding GntR family transcriptional regulator
VRKPELAEQLGVSHIPVREALAALEALGHVTRVARVGFFVAELSLEDIEDIYHWRELLEDEAHRLAMPRLTDDDLETMRDVNDRMLAAAREHTTQFLGLNRQFHFIPFERAGSRHLLRFLTHLWDAAARYEHAIAFVELPKSLLQEHHSGLLAAFAARDLQAANDMMRQHRAVARDVIPLLKV